MPSAPKMLDQGLAHSPLGSEMRFLHSGWIGWIGSWRLQYEEVPRCKSTDAILIVASDGHHGPGIQAGFNLASNCCELLKCENQGTHHSFEVELHTSYSCLPKSTEVGASGRNVLPGNLVLQEVLVHRTVEILCLQKSVQLGELILGSNEVGAIVTPDSVRSASSGNKPVHACQEGTSCQVRDDLQVYCSGREADKHTDIGFDVYRLSGVPLLQGEGASKIQACSLESWRWSRPLHRQVSHQLRVWNRLGFPAGFTLAAHSPAQSSSSQHMELGSYRGEQQ